VGKSELTVIVIDGPSSSGKTSILQAFHRLAAVQHLSFSIDEFLPILPVGTFEARAGSDSGWIAICRDFHEHLAIAQKANEKMIVEVMLPWPEARQDLFRQLGRAEIYYVQCYCALPELERRERQRGDRRIGLTRSHFERVYAFRGYDLQIDTTVSSPEECAAQILAGAEGGLLSHGHD